MNKVAFAGCYLAITLLAAGLAYIYYVSHKPTALLMVIVVCTFGVLLGVAVVSSKNAARVMLVSFTAQLFMLSLFAMVYDKCMIMTPFCICSLVALCCTDTFFDEEAPLFLLPETTPLLVNDQTPRE